MQLVSLSKNVVFSILEKIWTYLYYRDVITLDTEAL